MSLNTRAVLRVLLVALCVSLLTACGGAEEPGDNATDLPAATADTPEEVITEEAEVVVTVEVMETEDASEMEATEEMMVTEEMEVVATEAVDDADDADESDTEGDNDETEASASVDGLPCEATIVEDQGAIVRQIRPQPSMSSPISLANRAGATVYVLNAIEEDGVIFYDLYNTPEALRRSGYIESQFVVLPDGCPLNQ